MAFQNARDFAIGVFNVHNDSSNTPDPIEIIEKARAVEVTHTSKTSSYEPTCHPQTRTKIINIIVTWGVAASAGAPANHSSQPTSILWLQGPAGGGKTCIMREVARQLIDQGLLAATFFFSIRLLGTVPGMRPAILKAVVDNVGIFRESLETQMNQLVLKPLAEVFERGVGGRHVLVVDAFEEREHLLRILHALITSTPSLILIIASRPEYDIRTTFGREDFKAMTRFLRLQDYKDDSEIHKYLCDEFRRIRGEHPAHASIPASWPAEEALATLIKKSSGNYTLPSIVIKHVDSPRRNPIVSLQEVMGCFELQMAAPPMKNPLAPLDAIYTMILHPPDEDIVLMKRMLHCMSQAPSSPFPLRGWTPEFLDQLLELEPGTTEITLCDIHSAIGISASGVFVFHHATVRDFLSSQVRSKDFFQNNYETLVDVTCACARQLKAWSRGLTGDLVAQRYASYNMPDILLDLFRLASLENAATRKPLPQTILQFDYRLICAHRMISVDRHQWSAGLDLLHHEPRQNLAARTQSATRLLLTGLHFVIQQCSKDFTSNYTLGLSMSRLSLLQSILTTLDKLPVNGAVHEFPHDMMYIVYTASELLDLCDPNPVVLTAANDVYSFAMVAYELFTGEDIFPDISAHSRFRRVRTLHSEVVEKQKRPSRPAPNSIAYTRNGMTNNIWEMIEDCWAPDPKKRPTARDILSRPFMTLADLDLPSFEPAIF